MPARSAGRTPAISAKGWLAPRTAERSALSTRRARRFCLPFAYEVASGFVNGRAWVRQDGLYRLIDKSGSELSDEYWDNVFSEFNRAAYSRVMRNGLWGYADENGAVALQPVYEKATRFNDGLAAVRKDGTWYLIDEHGVDVLSGEDTQA